MRRQPSHTFIVLMLLALCTPGVRAAGDEQTTYELKDQGFKVLAPAAWKPREPKVAIMKLLLTVDAPLTKGEVIPSFNIIVNGDTVPDGQEKAALGGIEKQMLKESPDAVVSDSEVTTLDGVKALRHSYTKTLNGLKMKGFHVVAIRHGKLYTIGFFATPAVYPTKVAEAQKVVDSWKWTD